MFLAKHSAIDDHPRAKKSYRGPVDGYTYSLLRIICALSMIKVAKLLLILVLFMVTNNSSCTITTNTTEAAYFAEYSANNITRLNSGYSDDVGQNYENVNASHEVAQNIGTTNESPLDNKDDNNNNENNPSEVQKAVCTVTAGEVRASAEAVTTKTLKGVCGSAEMNLALRNLEMKLYEELQEIKNLIKNNFNNPDIVKEEMQSFSTTEIPAGIKKDSLHFQTIQNKKKPALDAVNSKSQIPAINNHNHWHDYMKTAGPKLKSLPSKLSYNEREQEVSKFNNTMLTDRDLKVFTYYWKLENVTEHIATIDSHTVESQIFSIKGKPLHIRAFFQHLHRDFLYLQLECAPLNTSNNHNSIILDTGGLFKEIANDKILFKHKISILNQSNQRSQDLVSQEFFNLETGFLIPNSALVGSSYVKNNSLLIQIFMYL